MDIQKRVKKPWNGDCELGFCRSNVVYWRLKTRSVPFLKSPLRLPASRRIPARMTSRKSGSSVVTVYFDSFPFSSTTTCMLLRQSPSSFAASASSSGPTLLPSDGIAVVLLLWASIALSLDSGFNRLLSSTSDTSTAGSGVHVSRLPERP
jgi:hypothetical protein